MKVLLSLSLLLLSSAVPAQSANDAGINQTSSFRGFNPLPNLIGTGSFDDSEATMAPRFFRPGSAGQPCSTFDAGNFQYQTIPFTADGSGQLTVSFNPANCTGTEGIYVTFHEGSFNPANICQNFIWSSGSSDAFTASFAVTPNTDKLMVISGVATAPDVVCGPFSFDIQGDGTGVTAVSPAALNLRQTVGGNVSLPLTISNTGSSALDVTAISALVAPFSLVAGGSCGPVPFTLSAGASCSINIGFAPLAPGLLNASVTISASGGDVTVPLIGEGVVAIALPVSSTLSSLLMLLTLVGVAGVWMRRHD